MKWNICTDTGMIQAENLIPLEVLYQSSHNDGVGKVWEAYYQAFADYIAAHGVRNILEIGGGSGKIAQEFLRKYPEANWYILEPNPLIQSKGNLHVIQGFFDDDFRISAPIDAIVHSQVFEHIYDPRVFLGQIQKFMSSDTKHIVGVPNLEYWLKQKFTNALNFEHTFLVNSSILEYFFSATGLKIMDRTSYQDLHLFYTTQKATSSITSILPNDYEKNKALFFDFIEHYKKIISKLNAQIAECSGVVYIFGAHIFTQFLLHF